jgi:hypothetical protein
MYWTKYSTWVREWNFVLFSTFSSDFGKIRCEILAIRIYWYFDVDPILGGFEALDSGLCYRCFEGIAASIFKVEIIMGRKVLLYKQSSTRTQRRGRSG